MTDYREVPTALKEIPNWVVWKYETRDGKQTKVPYDAKSDGDCTFARVNDAATWATFERAADVADILSGHDYSGIGFMLHDTGLVGFDFDGVVKDGVAEPFVVEILKLLGSPYCEITPSGNGLRAFIQCAGLPLGQRKFSTNKYGAEIYSGSEGGRYLTVTGNHFSGDGIPKIDDITLPYFLVSKIRDTKFVKLWMGDLSDYKDDQSRADLALLGILARAFNRDRQKMETAFGASKLAERAKWKQRADYRNRTLAKALGVDEANDRSEDYVHTAKAMGQNGHGALTVNLVPLSSIDAEIQKWLWENRIPANALTNLSGDADKGKSLVLYDLLSRISTGSDFPDGAKNPFGGQPKKVVLLFSEGSLKTTVKPRMMVMGANMENVIALQSVSREGEKDAAKRQFCLETDFNLLREALRKDPEIVAIGFDPITNYLGDDCDMNRSQDVRRVLTPLGELAEECGITVISIIHFSKNTAMNAIHRTGGAAALIEVPRAAWCCMNDDDPENEGGFVFLRIKNNLGKRVGGLSYRIEETFIPIDGQRSSVPKLVWGKETQKTADDLLGLQNNPEMRGVAKAQSWLEATFKDDCARKSTVVFKAALAVGINDNSLRRGKESLQMESRKIDWAWYMRRRQGRSQPWTIATDLEEKLAGEQNENSKGRFDGALPS